MWFFHEKINIFFFQTKITVKVSNFFYSKVSNIFFKLILWKDPIDNLVLLDWNEMCKRMKKYRHLHISSQFDISTLRTQFQFFGIVALRLLGLRSGLSFVVRLLLLSFFLRLGLDILWQSRGMILGLWTRGTLSRTFAARTRSKISRNVPLQRHVQFHETCPLAASGSPEVLLGIFSFLFYGKIISQLILVNFF